jgi:nucleoside 2-deoxyribosyltransferase
MGKTKVIYIAGPFRAATSWGIAKNVRAAEERGFECASVGGMPLIPHANTAHFHGCLTDEFWLSGTMELLRRCDAVLLVPGWEGSTGTKAEIREAGQLAIPVFETVTELEDWLGS